MGFSTLTYGEPKPDSTFAQNQNKSRLEKETLGPALVTPPDALTDETLPMEAETAEEEPLQLDSKEPVPQIQKKKSYIDPRFRPESRFIEHPNAAKGLIKIDKEKVYHYKVKTSEQKQASSFRLGTYEPTELTNPDHSNLSFSELYDNVSFPLLLYDQERQFFQKFGKLGWKFGAGFYLAQGNGKFENEANTETPKENFTLFVFPLNIGLIYRMQFFTNQWIVPYAEGAVDAFCFGEFRDDDQNPALGAALGLAPAAHFSLGGSLAMGKDASAFLDLDREYGINTIYLSLEYRQYLSLSNKYDFSGAAITGGITAEY